MNLVWLKRDNLKMNRSPWLLAALNFDTKRPKMNKFYTVEFWHFLKTD